MNSTMLSAFPGHSRLRRLVALRCIAVVAQLVTLAIVWKILELELNWQPMLLTIARALNMHRRTLQRKLTKPPLRTD